MNRSDLRLEEAEIGTTTFMRRVRATGRLSFLDIDGTLTGDIRFRGEVRQFFDERSAVAFISARTPELMMSHDAWSKSREKGTFFRPEPKCLTINGRREFHALERMADFAHLLDTPAILSLGVGVFYQDESGAYRRDEQFHQALGGDEWRQGIALPFLEAVMDPDGELQPHLTLVSRDDSYEQGLTDVAPPDFRLDFLFESLTLKDKLKRRVQMLSHGSVMHNGAMVPRSAIAAGMKIVDESHPELSRYTAYLVRRPAVKEKILRRVIAQACRFSSHPRRELELFIAGDTLTDFRAGLLAGWSVEAQAIRGTFFLAGGSRLAPYLTGELRGQSFAGESLEWARLRLYLKGAVPGNQPGVYYFRAPWGGEEFRRVIIADEAFPGTSGAESLAAYINSDLCSW